MGIKWEVKNPTNLSKYNNLSKTLWDFSPDCWNLPTFVYDRFGNRTFNTTSNATTTLSQTLATKITNPQINTADNRLKKDQDNDTITDYDYDQNGNLTLDAENKRFVYDAENHQTKFLQTNSTQTPDAFYEYDGEGKRVRKITGQNETIFVYNGAGQMVAEYATQISSTLQVSYLTMDHLGSPRIITDGGGAVIARHDYTAFGSDVAETVGAVGGRTAAQGYGSIEQVRQGYTGYENDEESKLDYAQARYYNSAHGRFTSVDPLTASASIKDPQTFNRYSYALNSPYKFTDPLGLLALTSAGACGQFCRGTGGQVDGSAFRGTDISFVKEFAAMALNNAVDDAIQALNAGTALINFGSNLSATEITNITNAFIDILKNGTAEAQGIALLLVNSEITIMAGSGQAQTDFTDPSGANRAVQSGCFDVSAALKFFTITIDPSEISQVPNLEGTLIHEGFHAQTEGTILSNISGKVYSYDTDYNHDEVNAASAVAKYFIHRGGKFAKFGADPRVGIVDSTLKKVTVSAATSASPETYGQMFKRNGVVF